jgi:hypothetical protein
MRFKIMKSELNNDYIIAEWVPPTKFFKWNFVEGYWHRKVIKIKSLEDAQRLLNICINDLPWYTEVTDGQKTN